MQHLSYARLANCISSRSLKNLRLKLRKTVRQTKRAERDANIDLNCLEIGKFAEDPLERDTWQSGKGLATLECPHFEEIIRELTLCTTSIGRSINPFNFP